jgi:hypothetical protein
VTLESAGSVVQGLVINGRWGAGVRIAGPGATGNLIRGNYLADATAGTRRPPRDRLARPVMH